MNATKRELLTIWVLAAICGVAALAADHAFLAMVFVLEGVVAGVFAFR